MAASLDDRLSADCGGTSRLSGSRRSHGLILLGALLVPLLGATMALEAGGRVSLPGFDGHPLPTLCVSRQIGFECATCGATRSVIALMHGNWSESLRFHRFGWLMALVIFTQIPYRAYQVFRPGKPLPIVEACGWALLIATFMLVLGNWLFRLARLL